MKTFINTKDGQMLQLDTDNGYTAKVVLNFYGPGHHEIYERAEEALDDMVAGPPIDSFEIETHIIVPQL
jgi:hypothetical protein